MNLRKIIYNTLAIMVSLVLVFGGASEVFATEEGDDLITGQGQNIPQVRYDDAGNVLTSGYNGAGAEITSINEDSKPATEAQAQYSLQPGTATSSATSSPNANYRSITSNILGCSVGQILASIITTGITSALNGLSGLLGVWTGWPTHDAQLNQTQGFQTAVEQGFQVFGVYVGASLNSIAYCIINSIIEHIANSVIAWANSGFNGNPAFLQNPERFFQGLADQQASEFISALAYNTANAAGNIAMNVCAPFRKNVAVSLARSYGSYGNETAGAGGYASYGSCRLSTDDQREFFGGGRYTGNNFFSTLHNVALVASNNFIDQRLASEGYLANMIAKRAASELLDTTLGGGYRSSRVCTNPQDQNTCNIVAPGSTINNYVQKTTEAGQTRLLLSEKFDQVVSAVVNNLIRVGLNKLLEPKGMGIPAGTNFTGGSAYSTRAPTLQPSYDSNGQPINLTGGGQSIGARPQGL